MEKFRPGQRTPCDSLNTGIVRRGAGHLTYPHVMTCHLPDFTPVLYFRRELLVKRRVWIDVTYGIYLPKQDSRKAFTAKRPRTTWPGRVLNF